MVTAAPVSRGSPVEPEPCSSVCGQLGPSWRYLVFDHLHSDHQAFPADVADDLVLVSELCQLCHEVGADLQAVPLQAVLPDGLRKETRRVVTAPSP